MINKKNPKRVLIVLTILMFSLFAITTEAQGPNAPEAASFEPVDATDMVNLVTGDLSYVLPLLNVPSPEGGYPIALSYHAGIAMEQEASWVGLGWSLNPGTINRGVNGYPDDWGKTNVNEFFYDAGWTDDYYSFSAGVDLSDAVSVGLGLSWGSNQSLGGYVYANIGFKKAGFGVGGSIGTNGVSIHGGMRNGFNANIGTNGVGIGYGTRGSTNLGLSLNYSYNSGLSGGVSISKNGKFGDYISGQSYKHSTSASLGVNFSSRGVSFNASANGSGIGVSSSTNGITGSDYDVDISSGGFEINAYVFNVKYSHEHVTYSLYKYNNLYTSGVLNPIVANELKQYDDGSGLSRLLYENNFMDVNVLPKYNFDMEVESLLDNLDQLDKNNLVLPNYDNYSVTAQGLSGSLKPYVHSELNLSGRGRGNQNEDNLYTAYLNHNVAEYNSAPSSGINVNRDAVKKVNFTFDNAYNSFLRMERSDIIQRTAFPSVHSDRIMDYFETNSSLNFNNDNSLTANKKREANYIETYTNKEIRDSYAGGGVSNIDNFIDAKQYNNQNTEINLDRSDAETFLDDGIGAYQITTSDGRTYHYSLPVYNYESFYKNFKNENDEDENFFEIQKRTPYATHWLLTAITGPDYIDINTNGKVDENDYGYWVAFDYGKWSDGYVWETPNGHFNIAENDKDDKTYSYAWGRKQVYYLDAIKTRTHTALFVKDLRDDSKSGGLTYNNTYHSSGNFDYNQNPKILSSQYQFKIFGKPGDTYYDENNLAVALPSKGLPSNNYTDIEEWVGRENTSKYIDIPTGKSLALSKIILLKNEDVVYNKSTGSITSILNGKIYINNYISDAQAWPYGSSRVPINFISHKLYTTSNNVKNFQIDIHSNILDVKDIDALNLEEKAQQIIALNHDYSLAKSSPNSDADDNGRLTLKALNYKGKEGVQLVPPYKFSYFSPITTYNENNIDEWGYNNVSDQIWSLNEIQTPTGGKIKIDYEQDSYYAEAASYESKYFEDINFSKNGNNVEITFNDNTLLTDYFKVGRDIAFTFDKEVKAIFPNVTISKEIITTPLRLLNIVNNKLFLEVTNETEALPENISLTTSNTNCIIEGGVQGCYLILKLKNNQHPLYTDANLNGKAGGGIRTKSITISNEGKNIVKSEYIYTNPETNKISGITSYAPSNDPKGIPYVSELPPPMVTYEHVEMVNKDGNGTLLGSTSYKFGVLEPFHEEPGYIYSLGETFKVKENQNTTFENGSIIANKYTIHNCLGNVGRLLSVTSYNSKGQKLSEKQNNYKTDLDGDDEIGVTQESHKSYKRILKNSVESFAVSATSKINYPSVLESTTTTQGGFTNTTNFIKHDFLTGQLLESTTTDSKGTEFKTELIPAYTIADYNPSGGYGMGSKVDNPTNKNMLTQEAMTKTYIKIGGNWEETGVGITTWNNDWTYTDYEGGLNHETTANKKIWRKHKTFVWDGGLNPDGTLNGFTGEDDSFVWDVGSNILQTNSEWKNVSTTTQYDHYSMPLELKDINDNYAATKMCDDNSTVLAVSNAAYTEMYYSGAEYIVKDANGNDTDYFDGQVRTNDKTGLESHTGAFSEKIDANEHGFEVNLPVKLERTGTKAKFKISVWVKKGANNEHLNARVHINGDAKAFNEEDIPAGDWVLKTHYEELGTGLETVYITSASGTIYADDFKLHPIASSMTSYVYNEWDELWYIIGNNGLASRFEYDAAGRLINTYTEVIDDGTVTGGFKKVSQNSYNYKKP